MQLTFTNRVQELTYRKVAEYLASSHLFKASMQVVEASPEFLIRYGSTQVTIAVLDWELHPWESSELSIVRASSCLTEGSQVNTELMRFLLTENQRMLFGAFHLDGGDRIWFAESVLGGENMDLMELQTCILSVVTLADTYDDLIVAKFGGYRSGDRLI
jgi:hypothetical protein